jgi:hypothetical protein
VGNGVWRVVWAVLKSSLRGQRNVVCSPSWFGRLTTEFQREAPIAEVGWEGARSTGGIARPWYISPTSLNRNSTSTRHTPTKSSQRRSLTKVSGSIPCDFFVAQCAAILGHKSSRVTMWRPVLTSMYEPSTLSWTTSYSSESCSTVVFRRLCGGPSKSGLCHLFFIYCSQVYLIQRSLTFAYSAGSRRTAQGR